MRKYHTEYCESLDGLTIAIGGTNFRLPGKVQNRSDGETMYTVTISKGGWKFNYCVIRRK